MDHGVLYVATGDEFVEEAKISADTVRKSETDTSIAIVTDQPRNLDNFDDIIVLSDPSYGFYDKIQGMRQTPYDKTIFLDTDTHVWEDISELFDILEEFDIAATHNQNRDLYTDLSLGVPEAFPEYSSGVVVFDKLVTNGFFENWSKIYQDDHPGDQPSFRKALYECDLRLATIPREYNLSPRYPSHVVKSIKIFHGRLLDINSPGANKNIELEKITEIMNENNGHRLFDKNGYQVVPNDSLLYKLDKHLKTDGVIETMRKGLEKISGES